MNWHPFISVQIRHDFFDLVSLGFNFILGTAAIASLWISRKALRKSEFDSEMSTSPSIIIRPNHTWVGIKDKKEYSAHAVKQIGEIIKKDDPPYEIIFCIQLECFNAGRGVAFNISQPTTSGISFSAFQGNKIPLYLTKEDDSFQVELFLSGKFDQLFDKADIEIPVAISLVYMNDQNNIFCRSIWQANIKPFDKDGENLKVRDIRFFQQSGKIQYSQVPYEK